MTTSKKTFRKVDIKRKLAKGKCKVTFRKMDGDVRKMLATLSEDLIPKKALPIGEGRPEKVGLVRAYDLEAKAWRSFYVDRVRAFSPIA